MISVAVEGDVFSTCLAQSKISFHPVLVELDVGGMIGVKQGEPEASDVSFANIEHK